MKKPYSAGKLETDRRRKARKYKALEGMIFHRKVHSGKPWWEYRQFRRNEWHKGHKLIPHNDHPKGVRSRPRSTWEGKEYFQRYCDMEGCHMIPIQVSYIPLSHQSNVYKDHPDKPFLIKKEKGAERPQALGRRHKRHMNRNRNLKTWWNNNPNRPKGWYYDNTRKMERKYEREEFSSHGNGRGTTCQDQNGQLHGVHEVGLVQSGNGKVRRYVRGSGKSGRSTSHMDQGSGTSQVGLHPNP